MCENKLVAGPTSFSHLGMIVDPGTVWHMEGRKLIIDRPLLKYLNKGNDVSTSYLSFQFMDDNSWNICTHSMFKGSAKREEPLVERFITPRRILQGPICNDGVLALGVTLGVCKPNSAVWLAANKISDQGKMDLTYKVSELYEWYGQTMGGDAPDRYLMFLAKMLNLVPEISVGPTRYTLLRLLGIKE